jgi:uncharacterized protein YndB with AHSA1/START domain
MIGWVVCLARLAAGITVVAVAIDRILAASRGERPPIRSFVLIEAPIERVWAELVDIERQPRWMTDLKAVRVLTPGPLRVGSRVDARVRVLGIGVPDPVEIVEIEAPRRFALRHLGPFGGGSVIELEPGADGRTTLVSWDETLVAPLLPDLVDAISRPILAAIFQADLQRLRELIEEPPLPTPDELAGLAMEAEGGPPDPGALEPAGPSVGPG